MSSDGRGVPQGIDSYEGATALADPRSRRVLSVLLERSHPLTTRDLGVLLGAAVCGTSPARIPADVLRRIRTDLHHRSLPALEDAGLIDRFPEGAVVADDGVRELENEMLPALDGDDEQFWKAVAAILARPRRRELLSVVAGDGALSLEELATRLAARDPDGWQSATVEDDSTVTDASTTTDSWSATTLHHVDLPRLASVGVLRYDPAAKTVAPTAVLASLSERTGLVDTAGGELDAD